jgi:uncharacterized protein YprB with RNaseH-like and TPR domain
MKSRGLVWDIENSAFTIDTWGVYQADAVYIREIPKVLTIAWQWVGENKVHVMGQDDFKGYKAGINNDKKLVEFAWNLLNEADYTVAHNGDRHDVQVLNARMLVYDLIPPEPHKQVDTRKIYNRLVGNKLGGNSLKNLSRQFGAAPKGSAGSYEDTWLGCIAGDKKSWKNMKTYNKADIPGLMEIYLKSRAWDKQSVPLNVLEHRPDSCPKCTGTNIHAGMKYRATNTNLYQYFRCMGCGSNIKKRLPEPSVEKPLFSN